MTFSPEPVPGASAPEDTSQPVPEPIVVEPFVVPPVSLPRPPADMLTPLAWNSAPPRLQLPRGNQTVVSVAGHPVKLIALDDVIYSISDGRQQARFPIQDPIQQSAIAPDGSQFAAVTNVDDTSRILTFSLANPQVPQELQLRATDRPVRFMAFSNPDTLITQLGFGTGANLAVWDTKTGTVKKRLDLPSFNNDMATMSPDGTKLAIATSGSIQVLSVDGEGEPVELDIPPSLVATPFSNCRGIAFSPSGKELAALMPDHRIIVWSLAGEVLMDHTVYMPDAEDSEAHAKLQWLADGRGWVLYGNTVCLCDPVLAVWKIQHKGSYRSFPNIVVDRSHLLIGGGRADVGKFAGVTLPWVKIRKAVAELGEQAPLFGQPSTVRVAVKVSKARHPDTEVVAEQLRQAIGDRLALAGIKQARDSETILFVDHVEEVGTMKEVSINESLENVWGTKIRQRVELRQRNSGKVLWSSKFEVDSGIELRGTLRLRDPEQITGKGLRDRAFETVVLRLKGLSLPTLIASDQQNQLPLRATY
jgi:WD40 repeat protein